MARSKKKKFLRLLVKNKMAILTCFLTSAFLCCISYANKPPKQSEIEVHSGYVQNIKPYYTAGRGTTRWDYVILLNNQQFHFWSTGGASKDAQKFLQEYQSDKEEIIIEVVERNVLSKILRPAFSNMSTILSIRTDSHVYYNMDQSVQFYYGRHIFFLVVSLLPMVALFLILRGRWKST